MKVIDPPPPRQEETFPTSPNNDHHAERHVRQTHLAEIVCCLFIFTEYVFSCRGCSDFCLPAAAAELLLRAVNKRSDGIHCYGAVLWFTLCHVWPHSTFQHFVSDRKRRRSLRAVFASSPGTDVIWGHRSPRGRRKLVGLFSISINQFSCL